jgi:hypothetical protein
VFQTLQAQHGIVAGRKARQEKKAMKTSLLTVALAVATMPMMFAKSQVPPPANTGSTAKPAVTTTSKKHIKKSTKKVTPKTSATPAAAAKPATPAAPAK